ncbi:MAG: SIMPL domain-containing protein [Tepidisphaeraceae bacterium]|jgi:hypothetical protein
MITSDKPQSLPRRFIVSLQVGGAFFALANVICVAILGYVYLSARHEPKTIEVKGSAKKAIVSDTVAWDATITTRDPDLVKAYDKLKANADRVAAFIKQGGIADKEVTFSAIQTNKIFQREVLPTPPKQGDGGAAPAPSVVQTSKVEMYVLTQTITVESHEMDKVPALSRSITSLIKDGVEIESASPRYLYSKLSELKLDMLADATRDATSRATQIVTNANGHLGRLVEAKMGVMQINPKGVTDVSGTGNNDTTSLEKEILAVVTVHFELR